MKGIVFLSFYFAYSLSPSLIFAQYPQMDFPLQVGNVWQYNEGGYYSESHAIKDTLMPNGLTYTHIIGSLFSGYFRKEGTKVFAYYTSSDSEFVKYDFSLKVGDTLRLSSYGLDTVITTVFASGTHAIFGTERNYMSFFMDRLSSIADGKDMIADGFGLVQYTGELLHFELTGAVINGITYGQILGIDNSSLSIPDKFILLQNYPNPFNPETTISYSIPVETQHAASQTWHVLLKVYDILGNEVATLVDEEQSVGTYSVKFNASNAEHGRSMSSGIYFYTLRAGSYFECKKMLLLK